jgi:hypothetical protein
VSWAIIVTAGDGRPMFVTDETEQPAVYVSEEEAESVRAATPFALAYPSKVVELP